MSTLSLRLPESLHSKLVELAASKGVSMNQLVCAATGEKITALLIEDYLKQRGARSSRAKFKAVLAKIAKHPDPAAPLLPTDVIREQSPKGRRRRA